MPKIAVVNSNNTSFTVTNGLFKQSYSLVDSSTNLVNNVDGSQTLYLLWGDEVLVIVENTLNSPFAGNSIFGQTTPLAAQTAAQTAIGAAGSGGGGGGGGGNSTTVQTVSDGIDSASAIALMLNALLSLDAGKIEAADIVAAIQAAADIDAIILALNQIATNSGYPAGARTIAQSQSVAIASDQRVPIDNQRINNTPIATGIGVSDGGTQRIALSIDSKISGYGFKSQATIARSADTTPYLANDVLGGAFELPSIGNANGLIILSGVRIYYDIPNVPSGIGGLLLYLYSAVPPTVKADNAPFNVPATDRVTLLTPGGIDIGSIVNAVGGGSGVLQSDNLNIELPVGATGSIWGQLVTRNAFTPISASETLTVHLVTLGV